MVHISRERGGRVKGEHGVWVGYESVSDGPVLGETESGCGGGDGGGNLITSH